MRLINKTQCCWILTFLQPNNASLILIPVEQLYILVAVALWLISLISIIRLSQYLRTLVSPEYRMITSPRRSVTYRKSSLKTLWKERTTTTVQTSCLQKLRNSLWINLSMDLKVSQNCLVINGYSKILNAITFIHAIIEQLQSRQDFSGMIICTHSLIFWLLLLVGSY